jgi:nanoRNase/pAp phosphatase (c-di-AMP/oligoRNAs hydrolase)
MMMQECLDRLFEAVGGATSILILPHNDPDPDAIASVFALRHLLAERLGMKSHIAYKGIIGRAENKALVRYLGRPLRRLAGSDLRQSVPIALVDTQPDAGNNALPPKSTAAIVFDHHPWREATAAAGFADVRPELGATSTILTEYLQAAGIEPTSSLATALFYGIKTDTMGLSRGASPDDVAAYFYLQPRIDIKALVEIEHAQVPAGYFKSFNVTLWAARVYDGIIIAHMGLMDYPDLAAEMTDLLSRLEESQWVICTGVYKGTLILSVRTRSREEGAEHLVQAMVGSDGTAGGHGTMAGGQVPLGSRNPEQVALQLSQRALRVLQVAPEVTGKPLI